MYLLDTNHCSRILQNDESLKEKLSEITESIDTCSIVAGELLFMAYNSDQFDNNLKRVTAFLTRITVHTVDDEAAHIYGNTKAALIKKFGPKEKKERRKYKLTQLGISDNDLWIASVALAQNLIVLSQDSDFAKIKEVSALKVECWIK